MDAKPELVEDHVVAHDLPAGAVAFDVDAVTVRSGAALAASVENEAAVDLDIVGRILGVKAVASIVNDQVDEFEVVRILQDIDARGSQRRAGARVGVVASGR